MANGGDREGWDEGFRTHRCNFPLRDLSTLHVEVWLPAYSCLLGAITVQTHLGTPPARTGCR